VKKLEAQFKLWLNTEDSRGVFGDGKWRLLKAIDKEGSLRAASQMLKISYRKAWGDLKKAEDALNVRLIEKRRGGNAGGRTGLTPEGKEWVKAYAKLRAEIERTAKAAHKKHFGGLGK
jgi:molybdate transport system regulatory protein